MATRQRPKNTGSALVLAMAAILLMSLIGTGLLSMGLRGRIQATRNVEAIVARSAADAGLTRVLYEMNAKLAEKPWNDSILPEATSVPLANCDATFSYTMTGDITSGYTVEVIGRSGQAEKKITATLGLVGPYEHAVFVDDTLTLKSGTPVKGYNSSDPGKTGVKVKIGTNSTLDDKVILNYGVDVDGDILVGPGGDVDYVIKDLGATTEDRYAVTEEAVLIPATPPALPDMGEIDIKGDTLIIGPDDSGKYEDITLKRTNDPGVLEIAGGDVILHVTDEIDLGQDCEIIVREGASLVLYLEGDLDAGNNSSFNNLTQIPTSFKLSGTSQANQDINLKAKSDFFGAVYAPNADVLIFAGGDIYGAFKSNSFEMKSGGELNYDEALQDVEVDDDAVRFVVKQWREQ